MKKTVFVKLAVVLAASTLVLLLITAIVLAGSSFPFGGFYGGISGGGDLRSISSVSVFDAYGARVSVPVSNGLYHFDGKKGGSLYGMGGGYGTAGGGLYGVPPKLLSVFVAHGAKANEWTGGLYQTEYMRGCRARLMAGLFGGGWW